MCFFSTYYVIPSIISSPDIPLDETMRCQSLVYAQSRTCAKLIRVFRFELFRPPGFMSQLVTRLLQMMGSNSMQNVVVGGIGICCVIDDLLGKLKGQAFSYCLLLLNTHFCY
jgi:hypothetical protein